MITEDCVGFNWQGASGRWYSFDVARAKREWDQVGGVYMFVKPNEYPSGEWGGPIVLYIAKTNDFARALERHDMWAAADQLGAKEVHILPINDDQLRLQVERDLIEAQVPYLNRQTPRRAA